MSTEVAQGQKRKTRFTAKAKREALTAISALVQFRVLNASDDYDIPDGLSRLIEHLRQDLEEDGKKTEGGG